MMFRRIGNPVFEWISTSTVVLVNRAIKPMDKWDVGKVDMCFPSPERGDVAGREDEIRNEGYAAGRHQGLVLALIQLAKHIVAAEQDAGGYVLRLPYVKSLSEEIKRLRDRV
jgi:hypothetical protein